LFGPNARPEYHHREKRFEDVYSETEQFWRERFDVPPGAAVLFVTGSGTLALEAALNSLLPHQRLWIPDAIYEFSTRLQRLALKHGRLAASPEDAVGNAFVTYETGDSLLRVPPQSIVLADCVSSFPYYDAPKAEIVVTVASKQLGAWPGLSVVVVRESAWARMKDVNYEYSSLNLCEYAAAAPQTPHTPAIMLLQDLRDRLAGFDLARARATIDARRAALEEVFAPSDIIGGGPVFTVRAAALPVGVARDFRLYKSRRGYQLFLWSGDDHDYDRFIHELQKTRCSC